MKHEIASIAYKKKRKVQSNWKFKRWENFEVDGKKMDKNWCPIYYCVDIDNDKVREALASSWEGKWLRICLQAEAKTLKLSKKVTYHLPIANKKTTKKKNKQTSVTIEIYHFWCILQLFHFSACALEFQ